MAQEIMYPGIANSPQTELASGIDDSQTTIPLLDASVLPAAPNLATIGTGEDAETILYTGVDGNDLTGVTRGFEGVAKSWSAGAKVARNFTNRDYEALVNNIGDLVTGLGDLAGAGRTDETVKGNADALAAHKAETVSQWINVKYPPAPLVGAVGDGIADDTAAIQAVIDFVAPTQGTVFIPNGKFLIAGTLNLKNGVSMVGAGIRGSILLKPTSSPNHLLTMNLLKGSPNRVSNLTISAEVGGNYNVSGINVTSCDGLFFDNLWINGFQNGIYIENSGDIALNAIVTEYCANGYYFKASHGISGSNLLSFSATNKGFIVENTLYDETSEQVPYSVLLSNCRSEIDTNYGFWFDNVANVQIDNCSVSDVNNKKTVTGVYVRGRNVTLNNCSVSHCRTTGIEVDQSNGVKINNCQVRYIGRFSDIETVTQGILVQASSAYTWINGGTVEQCGGHGIRTLSTTLIDRVDVRNNGVYAANGQGDAGILIDVELAARFVRIDRCLFDSNPYNVYIEKLTKLRMTNNEFVSAGTSNYFAVTEPTEKEVRGNQGYTATEYMLNGRKITYGTAAPTTGTATAGDIRINTTPTLAKNISQWVCVSSGTPGTWVAQGCGQGTTAQRPTLVAGDAGYSYFDTTLQKMIAWSGSAWLV